MSASSTWYPDVSGHDGYVMFGTPEQVIYGNYLSFNIDLSSIRIIMNAEYIKQNWIFQTCPANTSHQLIINVLTFHGHIRRSKDRWLFSILKDGCEYFRVWDSFAKKNPIIAAIQDNFSRQVCHDFYIIFGANKSW